MYVSLSTNVYIHRLDSLPNRMRKSFNPRDLHNVWIWESVGRVQGDKLLQEDRPGTLAENGLEDEGQMGQEEEEEV